MEYLNQIKAVWEHLSVVQRGIVGAIGVTVIISITALGMWASRPDMQILYSGLDANEASKIVEKIAEKNVAYKLANGGTTIYVPREHVSQLHLDMAGEGLPEVGLKGYKIFDDQKIGISPSVQNVNLKRALQEELAKSIQMIDGVVSARIHINDQKDSLFVTEESNASASVVLRLRPGYRLSGMNIAAITHLVSGSVEGLSSEAITVVDGQGRLLSTESDQGLGSGAGTVADYRERVEEKMARKAEEMLTTVLGPGRAKVEVSAEVDMKSTNLVTKKYEPKGVATSETITKTSKPVADGDAGAKETSNDIKTEMQYGETVETVADLPGEIISLTVAAFVDLSPPEVKVDDGEEADAAATAVAAAPIMTTEDVEEIIRNALGLKESDSLKVVDVKFNRAKEDMLAMDDGGGLDLIAIAGQASMGVMAVCALVVLKMFSGTTKKKGKKGEAAEGAGEGKEGEEEGVDPRVLLRRQIVNSLQENPEQAKQLLTSWLE